MLILGVDVAKVQIAAAVWQDGRGHALGSFANTPAGWDALATHLPAPMAADPAQVTLVLEPTGGYELGLALWAYRRGWLVRRPNPRHVRDWAKSQGRRAKTDAQDAQVLAQYGAQVPSPLWQPLPAAVSDLEQLVHRRDEVEALLQRERARRDQVAARPEMPSAVRQSIERLLEALEHERGELEQAIADHLRQHPELAAARTRLLAVPGVGARNVLPLLVLLARWQAQTGGCGTVKGLVAYAGLDPQPYQSGTSVQRHATISRMGERLLRSRLYMGALGALRGHNPVRSFYDHLVSRGKAKKLALVAAARKILVWAWAVFHSGAPFDAAKATARAA